MQHLRVVFDSLADEFHVMNAALAAVKLAHHATAGDNEGDEIPAVKPPIAHRRDDPCVHRRGAHRGRVPQDLVGAHAGETAPSGRDIGAIEIADRFSHVEIPESAVDDVITALKATKTNGKKPTICGE